MICPECSRGIIQVKASSQISGKAWFKTVACPKCYGSGVALFRDGEDASCEAVAVYLDEPCVGTPHPLIV